MFIEEKSSDWSRYIPPLYLSVLIISLSPTVAYRPLEKNYSAKHGTDRNFDSFRRNSGCFVERKTLGIPFRAILWKIKKAQNSVPNHVVEEKNLSEIFNFLLNHSAEDKNARNSVPNHFVEEKNTWNFVRTIERKKRLLKTCSKPFKDKEKHSDDFKKTFFCGI